MKNKIKRYICLITCIFMICACLSSCGFKDKNPLSKKIEKISKKKDKETDKETFKDETNQHVTTNGGGEEGYNTSTIKTYEINIVVSGNDYLLNDESTTIEEILDSIMNVDGDVIVTVTDDYASYNAYKKLIKEFDEKQIDYNEQ